MLLLWREKPVGGSHAAILMKDPNLWSDYGPTLYDPSGSYTGEYAMRPSSGVFMNDFFREEFNSFSLEDYLQYHLENDGSVTMYTINTTEQQEANLIDQALELGDGFGFSCSLNVSTILEEFGVKSVLTPGGLEKQMEQMVKDGNVTKQVITKQEPSE